MVVCERPGFWRWLAQGLFGAVRHSLGGIGYMFTHIRDPFCEVVVGVIAFVILSVFAFTEYYDLALTKRIILALLAVPSFLIMMHGIYRWEGDDC